MAFKEISLCDIEHIEFYVPDKRASITSAYNTHFWNGRKCNVICNGSLFDMGTQSNSTITYGANNGKQIGYLFSKNGFLFNGDEVRFGTLDEAIKLGCDFVGSAPLLSKDGKYVYDWGNRKPSPSVTGKHIRTGIGLSKDKIVLYTSDGEITLETLNTRLKAKGCTEILNFDGGGSTSMIVDGRHARNTSRLLANFIMIWTKSKSTTQNIPSQVKKEDDEVISREKILINNKLVELDTITKDGKTFIEMRELSTLLNAVVGYNPITKQKSITKK